MKRSNKSKFQLGGRTENGSLPRHNKLAQYGMSNDSVKSYESPTIAGDGLAAEVANVKAAAGAVTGVFEGATKAADDAAKEKEGKDPSKHQMIPPPDVIKQPEAPEEQKQKEIDTSDVYNQVARVSAAQLEGGEGGEGDENKFSTYSETNKNFQDKGVDWTKYGFSSGQKGYNEAVVARSKIKNSNPSDWRSQSFNDNSTWDDIQKDINTQMSPSKGTSKTPDPVSTPPVKKGIGDLKKAAETNYGQSKRGKLMAEAEILFNSPHSDSASALAYLGGGDNYLSRQGNNIDKTRFDKYMNNISTVMKEKGQGSINSNIASTNYDNAFYRPAKKK